MEILHGIVVLVVVGGALVAAILAFIISCFLVRVVWPTVMGAVGAYFLWLHVDLFLAIVFSLVCLIVQIWWLSHIKEDSYIEGYKAEKNKKKNQLHDTYLPNYFDY